MSEKISEVIQSVEKDKQSSPEQIKKAKEVLNILTQKNKQNLQINADTRAEAVQILKEVSLDSSTSAEVIESYLNVEEISEESISTLPQEKVDEIGSDLPEQLEREGWDKVYIFTKMLSLGYIPKLHDMKYESKFKGQKVKWIWNNSRYLAVGGPLTNGKINTPFTTAQENVRTYFSKLCIGEEGQLKVLLNSVRGAETEFKRKQIDKRLKRLNELKTAFESGNPDELKKAAENYSKVSEETGKIKGLFEKYGVKDFNKKEIDLKEKKIKEEATDIFEKDVKAEKEKINNKFDKAIQKKQKDITDKTDSDNKKKKLKETKLENSREDLDNKIEEKQKLNDEKTKLNEKYTRTSNDVSNENLKKKPNSSLITNLENEKNKITVDITNVENKISLIDIDISNLKKAIRITEASLNSYKGPNFDEIEKISKEKQFLENLKIANETGNYVEAEKLLNKYKIDNSGVDFELDKGKFHEQFMKTDHKKEIDDLVKNTVLSKTDKQKIAKDKIVDSIDKEAKSIKEDIKKIDDEIVKIKADATKQLNELNSIASKDPKKVPELRAKAEKLVGDMNIQISALEGKGVKKIQLLKPDELKLLATNSKWTERMIATNGGIDKLLSGTPGKIFGVAAIALLTKGVSEGVSKDGIFTKETGLNIADLGVGMIPVVGGIYDIGMAIKGEDWNGRKMENSEKLMRLGFGVVGLVPLVGTAVKWVGTAGKLTTNATKITQIVQKGEFIIQAGHVTGKVAGLTALGYGGFTTVKYLLPGSK